MSSFTPLEETDMVDLEVNLTKTQFNMRDEVLSLAIIPAYR